MVVAISWMSLARSRRGRCRGAAIVGCARWRSRRHPSARAYARAEIRRGGQHPAQQHVAGEAGVIVERDRTAHPGVEPPEGRRHRGDGLGGGLAGKARHQRDPGLALVHHQHRSGASADHEVGLPVPHRLAGISVVGSLRNVGFLGDRVARRRAWRLRRRAWRRVR